MGKRPAAKKRAAKSEAVDYERLFAPFLKANPDSKISHFTSSKGVLRHYIDKPWNDESLVLFLTQQNAQNLADAINPVVLPQRFSAIWHSDTKDFEVIWTAFRLAGPSREQADRKFDFSLNGKTYRCEFGESSERLLAIAEAFVQVRGTVSSYRNLISFEALATKTDQPIKARLDKPRSFWIRNVEWNEDSLVDLAYHLNFYMSYFDDKTTKIIIHPRPEVSAVKPQERYIAGKFPAQIRAKIIDPNVLHFWDAAHGADDQSKSFLYYYRLIEYASTTYIDKTARAAVRRLLSQPNVLDDPHALTEQLVLAAQTTKQDDEQRVRYLFDDTVDKRQLWREIEKNMSLFNKETKFEGGFTLEPFIAGQQKAEHLDLSKFAKHIKDIRNALSHGRDIRTQMVIIPTQRNFDLLQPWVTLMCVVAGQVVLFKGLS
ncbi:hypothetical protein AB7M49_007128 [Bradyrhizobium elkanii]